MKKVIVLVCLLILQGCSSNIGCDVNNNQVCFDEETNQYQILEDTNIVVAFENDQQAEAIIELWNSTYPELSNVIEPVIYQDFSYDEFQNSYADIALLDLHHAVVLKNQLALINEDLMNKLNYHIPQNMIIDENEIFFIPLFAYGTAFATNVDLLEGETVNDLNNDGLIDSYDSFEKMDYYGYKLPVYLDDSMFGYPFYSFGYDIFNDVSTNPFEGEEFLAVLNNIASFASKYYLTDWTFEEFLDQSNQAFGLIGPWMYYNETDANMMISKMPTYNGLQLEPLVYPTGYVLNAATLNADLAMMVLNVIYSEKGLQAIIDNSDKIVVYNFDLENYVFDEDQEVVEMYDLKYKSTYDQMFAKAYLASTIEDFKALEQNTAVRYFDSLNDIAYVHVINDLYNGKITVEQAQALLVDYYNEWLNSYIVEEE